MGDLLEPLTRHHVFVGVERLVAIALIRVGVHLDGDDGGSDGDGGDGDGDDDDGCGVVVVVVVKVRLVRVSMTMSARVSWMRTSMGVASFGSDITSPPLADSSPASS